MCTSHVYTTLHPDGHRETSRQYILCSASRHSQPCADLSIFKHPPTHLSRPRSASTSLVYPSPPSSRSSSAARHYTYEEYSRRPVVVVSQRKTPSPRRVRIQVDEKQKEESRGRRERIQRQIELDNAEIARRPREPRRERELAWDRMREEELRVRIDFLNRQEQWTAERLRMRERVARQAPPEHWRHYAHEYRWP
ncbi:hypothetical protein CDD81_236 [Ophiocordyceps australis]|uniref:Uncharacterized protein n=1 Tax=Ophiocordyceps australis TaxID=1399860 RepID=A0A2C5YEY7_9HYPO|nr:hypothetical protein CDD81_236 [Ophiocordyceps australis]